jgi:serine/threonine protein phosphatase PrpC
MQGPFGDGPGWTYHGRTDVGRRRILNEDAFGFDPGEGLIVVADGMGGHHGGSVASRVAVEGVMDAFAGKEDVRAEEGSARLAGAVKSANRDVLSAAEANPELAGMGCTIVTAWVRGGRLHVCHLGDSRAYLGLPGGELVRLTRDHSYVEVLTSEWGLTPEEARAHPMRNIVTRAVGTSDNPKPECSDHDLPGGARVLLCTDGLWSLVPEGEISRILFSSDIPEEITLQLVDAANEAGGNDNVTAAVALSRC